MSTDYCRHYECQCATAAELAWMSDRLQRADLLAKAVDIHKGNAEVRCRRERKPRRGNVSTGAMAPVP